MTTKAPYSPPPAASSLLRNTHVSRSHLRWAARQSQSKRLFLDHAPSTDKKIYKSQELPHHVSTTVHHCLLQVQLYPGTCLGACARQWLRGMPEAHRRDSCRHAESDRKLHVADPLLSVHRQRRVAHLPRDLDVDRRCHRGGLGGPVVADATTRLGVLPIILGSLMAEVAQFHFDVWFVVFSADK